MELRVAIRIFDGREQKHLSHILSLASKRGEVAIVSVPAAVADVIFIKQDEPGASVFLKPERRGTLPLAVVYDEVRDGQQWFLQKPATSNELIPLLRDLQQAVARLPRRSAAEVAAAVDACAPQPAATPLAAEAAATGASNSKANTAAAGNAGAPAASPADAPLAPTVQGQALLEHLRRCALQQRVYAIEIDGNHVLVLDGKRKLAFVPAAFVSSVRQLMDVLAALSAADFQELPEEELAELLESHHASTVPLEQFTWTAGQYLEPRLPLPEDVSSIAFRLKRWPTFTRLRYKPVHMQWAGRLMKTAQSIGHLGTDPAADALEAAKFYNACVAAGLAILDAAAPLPALAGVPADGARQGLFQRILKRLMK